MDIPNLRWWGWGTLDRHYPLKGRTALWPTLQKWLQLPDEAITHETPPTLLEDIVLRPCRMDDPVLQSLRRLVGDGAVRTDRRCRVEHAYGKSYRDLIRIRAGHIPHPPDVVVYPANQREVAAVVAWAADRDIIVIPFGGGSSVLGGVEPPAPADDDRPVLTLDLAPLDRVLSIDPTSRTARIQAGATGPEIEAQLNAQGFTLGHFPESFEFSTLGGWIATRSAGQNSIGYGKIEQMTQAVRLVTPVGIVETRDIPATATGPSILELMIGSEGAYGVITEATMRIHPQPAVQDYRGVLFSTLEDGLTACRELMQSPTLHPAILRLSDPSETAAYAVMEQEQRGLRRVTGQLVGGYLRYQGFDLRSGSSLMLLGFEGEVEETACQWRIALAICRAYGGRSLGRSVGRSWLRDRYAQPYLRDTLIGHGILVDTLGTTAPWSRLMAVYRAMTGAIEGAIVATDSGPGYVMAHISHAGPHGASLSATFLGRQLPDPDPLARQTQWQEIKRAATDAIIAAGGTLTHHRGVGQDHIPWLRGEIGPLGVQIIRTVKRTLDPYCILNPHILIPPPSDD